MILRSPLPDVSYPDVSLPAFVLEHAAEHGSKPALIDGPSGRTITYAELAGATQRLAGALAARGLRKGDVVGLWSPNLPEWAVMFHGALSAGLVVTTVSSLASADDAAAQLADAGAKLLFTVGPFLEKALPAARKAGVAEVVAIGAPEDADVTPLGALLAEDAPAPDVAIGPDDLAVLPYSSGTSGLPKGVELTHRNLVANVEQTRGGGLRVFEGDTIIAVLPFFHIYGMTVILDLGLRVGATLVTMPKFELEPFLGLLEKHRVTRAFVVPPIVLAFAKHPAVEGHDLSSLTLIFSGAAPLDEALAAAASERVGAPVAQGYGMTEMSPVSHITPDDDAGTNPGAIGLLAPNTEARIVDPETGEDAPAGERGELWCRGPQIMRGYLNNPTATRNCLDEEGWLRTGDIVEVDEDGWFMVVDRLKELIKYKGYQVAPAELEALLVGHPQIADAAVIGVPDEDAGEVPKGFIVASGDVTPDEVTAWVAERVSPYKRLRAVEIVDEIPKSASGKILRRLLVDRERAGAAQ
jgi:acyl-CoA synthetase (AMP-forming)/AMP-acid ligase II